jgi:hypothetical protein
MFAIVVVVIAVGGFAFCVWMVGLVIRLISGVIGALFGYPVGGRPALGPDFVVCRNLRCAKPNPRGAAFCRRCGQPLGPPTGGGAGRAAACGAVNTGAPWLARWSMYPASPARQWRLALREHIRQVRLQRRQARLLRRQARHQQRHLRAMLRNTFYAAGLPPNTHPESDGLT